VPDARSLAYARVALGTLFLLRTTPILKPLGLEFTAETAPLLGWPRPEWQGAALGLAWPAWLLAAACIVRTLAALGFTLGIRTRACGIVAAAAGYLVLFRNPFGMIATLHLLYQGTFVLALTDAGSTLALRPTPARHVASSLLLVRCFLASIYFWAALVKLRPDWLDGRTLELFQADGAIRGPLAGFVLQSATSRSLVAWTIALTELSLPLLLLTPRTRRWSPFVAMGLHSVIELSARPDLLGWEMGALLLSLWPAPPEPSAERVGPNR
jgi:uncharacterized membrane protein YphA (DoxX/SURF4 family)